MKSMRFLSDNLNEVRNFSFKSKRTLSRVGSTTIAEVPVLPPPHLVCFIVLGMASTYGWITMSMSLVKLGESFGQHTVTWVGFYYGLAAFCGHLLVLRVQKVNEKAWPVETRIRDATCASLVNVAGVLLTGLVFADSLPSGLRTVLGPLLTISTGFTDAIFIGAVMGVASSCGGEQMVGSTVGLVLGYILHIPLFSFFGVFLETDKSITICIYFFTVFVIVSGFSLWQLHIKARIPSAAKLSKFLSTISEGTRKKRQANKTGMLFKKARLDLLCNVWQICCTYIVWPVLIIRLHPTYWDTSPALFYTILTYTMCVADFFGRVAAGIPILRVGTKLSLLLALGRCAMMVVLAIEVSVLVETTMFWGDYTKVFFLGGQGFISGYLAAVTAVNAREKAKPADQRIMGLLGTLSHSVGIVIGSMLGAFTDALYTAYS